MPALPWRCHPCLGHGPPQTGLPTRSLGFLPFPGAVPGLWGAPVVAGMGCPTVRPTTTPSSGCAVTAAASSSLGMCWRYGTHRQALCGDSERHRLPTAHHYPKLCQRVLNPRATLCMPPPPGSIPGCRLPAPYKMTVPPGHISMGAQPWGLGSTWTVTSALRWAPACRPGASPLPCDPGWGGKCPHT